MRLSKLTVERYKGYQNPSTIELAPLTILVGANNSGKSALARAIQLFAGGLAKFKENTNEPLPLKFDGITHGSTFEDLVSGRPLHGKLSFAAQFEHNKSKIKIATTIRNVESPNQPSERQIENWNFCADHAVVELTRKGFEKQTLYDVSTSEKSPLPIKVLWTGILPNELPNTLASYSQYIELFNGWASGVRYLRCPRYLIEPPFPIPDQPPEAIGPNGQNAPFF